MVSFMSFYRFRYSLVKYDHFGAKMDTLRRVVLELNRPMLTMMHRPTRHYINRSIEDCDIDRYERPPRINDEFNELDISLGFHFYQMSPWPPVRLY